MHARTLRSKLRTASIPIGNIRCGRGQKFSRRNEIAAPSSSNWLETDRQNDMPPSIKQGSLAKLMQEPTWARFCRLVLGWETWMISQAGPLLTACFFVGRITRGCDKPQLRVCPFPSPVLSSWRRLRKFDGPSTANCGVVGGQGGQLGAGQPGSPLEGCVVARSPKTARTLMLGRCSIDFEPHRSSDGPSNTTIRFQAGIPPGDGPSLRRREEFDRSR